MTKTNLIEIIKRHIPLFGTGKIIEINNLSYENEAKNIDNAMNSILKCDDLEFSYESWAQTFEDSIKTPVCIISEKVSEHIDYKKGENSTTFYELGVPYHFTFASRLREIIQESNPQILPHVKEKFNFRTTTDNQPQFFGDFRWLFLFPEKIDDIYELANLKLDEKKFKEISKEKRQIHLYYIDRLTSEKPTLFNRDNMRLIEAHFNSNHFEPIESNFRLYKK